MSLPICTSDVSLMITRFQTLKPLYSKVSSPDANNPAIELKDNTAECQKQLDAVIHEISGLQTVMDSINDLHQQQEGQDDPVREFIQETCNSSLVLSNGNLSNIFMYCLPKDKYLLPASKLAPVLLTRIYRQWRDVWRPSVKKIVSSTHSVNTSYDNSPKSQFLTLTTGIRVKKNLFRAVYATSRS